MPKKLELTENERVTLDPMLVRILERMIEAINENNKSKKGVE